MWVVNSIVGAVLGLLLGPFQNLSPLAGLALVSAASAIVMLLIVRATSNQVRLASVKRSIQACVFEVRLFGDDPRAIFRAAREMARHNVTYLGLSLVPLLWMALPLGALLVHLDAYYGVAELAPGRTTIVKVRMKDASGPVPRLTVPVGVRVETPPVWIPSLREAAWRISTEAAGDYELTIGAGEATVTKTLTTTAGVVRRATTRPSRGLLAQFENPAERPVPDGVIESITVAYPSRRIAVLGWGVHWLVVFFVMSMAFALALRSSLKVVL